MLISITVLVLINGNKRPEACDRSPKGLQPHLQRKITASSP